MKKTIIIPVAIILGLIVAIKSGVLYAFFMLLLVGIIPGTQIIIPANVMLLLISTAMCTLFFCTVGREVFHFIVDRHMRATKQTPNSHLPKQRFSEI